MTRRFLGAVQFLTVLPVHAATASAGESAIFFPLTGALLGASAGAVSWALSRFLGRSLAALLAVLWLIAITGCLHEDGLADVADAIRKGRTRERMMSILKDSRIGSYGGVALAISAAVRWQALARATPNIVLGPACALLLSRASLVVLAGMAPPVGTGLGAAFGAELSRAAVIATVLQCVLAGCVLGLYQGWGYGMAMVIAGAVTVALARVYFVRRLGGVNGDCLGATCQVVEMMSLVILAWHRSY